MKKFFTHLSANKKLLGLSIVPVSIFLFLIVSILSLFLNMRLIDDPFFKFRSYKKIYNWDLPSHLMGNDLDRDEKKDLISVTGCAFLSSVQPDKIPEEKRCEATGISTLEKDIYSVGQKIGTSEVYDRAYTKDSIEWPFFAYALQSTEGKWMIVYKNTLFKSAHAYTINDQTMIEEVPLPVVHRIYVLSYTITSILMMPILYFLLLPSFIFSKF